MHCPSCGTSIPNVVASAPFCPYCGVRKPVEVAPPTPKPKPEKAEERFADYRSGGQFLVFDPRVGYALLGSHAPKGEPPRLRAWDLYNKRVAWEAMAGEPGIDRLEWEKLAVHAGNVYVGGERTLRVLDLFTGAEKWRSELSDKLAYDSHTVATRGMRIVDAAAPGARGAVWAVAVDDVICAFDRDTGQLLWRETREHQPRRYHPFDSGLLLLEYGHEVELVDPSAPPSKKTIVDKITGRIERFDLEGHIGVVQVDRWGWRERDGILLHDFVQKKELLFEAVDGLEDDVPSVTGQGRVFAAAESGAKLFAAPKSKMVELVPAFHIESLLMCGPTLMVLLRKHHGTSVRRFVGVDPQTLAIRFDLGELAESPSRDWTQQMCTNGQVTVLATGRTGESHTTDLLAIDPAGRVVWKVPVRNWSSHYFLGGHVAVHSGAGWQILRADTGEVLAE